MISWHVKFYNIQEELGDIAVVGALCQNKPFPHFPLPCLQVLMLPAPSCMCRCHSGTTINVHTPWLYKLCGVNSSSTNCGNCVVLCFPFSPTLPAPSTPHLPTLSCHSPYKLYNGTASVVFIDKTLRSQRPLYSS